MCGWRARARRTDDRPGAEGCPTDAGHEAPWVPAGHVSSGGPGPPGLVRAGDGPWRARARQLALAAVLTAVQVLGSLGAARAQPERRPLDLLALALLLVGPAAIATLTRRRVPPATVLVGAATCAYLLLGYPYGPVVASLVVLLVAAVVTRHRPVAWAVAAAVLASYGAAGLNFGLGWSWAAATAATAWTIVVLSLAEVARVRGERARTHRRALAEQRRRREGEDRLRIAQELHDVVAHHMSLINVQASVALHLRATHPDQVDEALAVIKAASKEALTELRSLIDVLREGDDPAPRHPAASLSALDDLVERARYAGVTLRARTAGTAPALAPGVELAAYRVVQEAVTNVVRHSGAGVAEVAVEHGHDALVVSVDDDGDGDAGALTEGNGIRGMRERAAALGGGVRLEQSRLGGVRVVARFPAGVTP